MRLIKPAIFFILFLSLNATVALGGGVVAPTVGGGGGGGGTMSDDAIMDAVQRTDGAASQLDCDFLDAISSQGFCQVTGGTTCTMVGTVVTGNSPDIASESNENLELQAQGTGAVKLWPEGLTNGISVTEPSSGRFLVENEGTNANATYYGVAGDPYVHGAGSDRPATELADCASDNIKNTGSIIRLKCTSAAGLTTSNAPQTCDCGTAGTPNTVTCDIQSDVVYLTDGDADGCTVTISETTASSLGFNAGPIMIVVTGTGGGGDFTVADSSGVVELAGGTSFTGNSVGDTLTLHYVVGGSLNSWYEMSRADN